MIAESRQRIEGMSKEQLVDFLTHRSTPGNADWHLAKMVLDRQLAEESRRPHWTVWLAIVIAAVAMLFAGISALPVLRSWFPASSDAASSSIVPPSR